MAPTSSATTSHRQPLSSAEDRCNARLAAQAPQPTHPRRETRASNRQPTIPTPGLPPSATSAKKPPSSAETRRNARLAAQAPQPAHPRVPAVATPPTTATLAKQPPSSAEARRSARLGAPSSAAASLKPQPSTAEARRNARLRVPPTEVPLFQKPPSSAEARRNVRLAAHELPSKVAPDATVEASGKRKRESDWLARLEARRAAGVAETGPKVTSTKQSTQQNGAKQSGHPTGTWAAARTAAAGARTDCEEQPSLASKHSAVPFPQTTGSSFVERLRRRRAAYESALRKEQTAGAPSARATTADQLAKERVAAADLLRRERAAASALTTATTELLKERAAAEAAREAADRLKERVEAAEARAVAAEEWAAAVAVVAEVAEERVVSEPDKPDGESGISEHDAPNRTPSWLTLLAGGEMNILGEVETLAAMSEAGVAARASAENLDDMMAKRVWLKSLDVPTWGKAAVELSEAASEAAEMAEFTAMCNAGDDVSCRILSEQAEATKAMMAKLNVSTWGEAAAVLSGAASDAAAVSAAALEELESFGFIRHRSMGSSDRLEDED